MSFLFLALMLIEYGLSSAIFFTFDANVFRTSGVALTIDKNFYLPVG